MLHSSKPDPHSPAGVTFLPCDMRLLTMNEPTPEPKKPRPLNEILSEMLELLLNSELNLPKAIVVAAIILALGLLFS